MGSLFSKPKAPKPEPIVEMPDVETVERLRKRKNSRRQASGRTSTILTDTLG